MRPQTGREVSQDTPNLLLRSCDCIGRDAAESGVPGRVGDRKEQPEVEPLADLTGHKPCGTDSPDPGVYLAVVIHRVPDLKVRGQGLVSDAIRPRLDAPEPKTDERGSNTSRAAASKASNECPVSPTTFSPPLAER